ncbi:MAG: glucosaminidase domain-containing protein [Propionibacteriaceae bacterium]|nr:glucosaminidase domain-containing protein [Propionibacteriaceae bacterium]
MSVPPARVIIGKWPSPPAADTLFAADDADDEALAPERLEIKLVVPQSDSIMAVAWRKTLPWHRVSVLLFDDVDAWVPAAPPSSSYVDAEAPAGVSEGTPQPEPVPPPPSTAPPTTPPSTDPGTEGSSYEDAPDNSRTGRYVQSLVAYAQEAQRRYGVPASVSISQAILESGWGDSSLARLGLAQFGIKCTSYMSQYQQGCWDMDTNEFVNGEMVNQAAGFRTYATVRDSVLDHALFLTENSRYSAAFATTSSADFAGAIAAAGYATDPKYAAKLIEIMGGWDLYRYDINQGSYATFGGWVSVTGDIGAYYYATSAYDRIGIPIGDEGNAASAGVRIWTFDHGTILWSSAHGAHAIYGGIWEQYRASWALRYKLGAPLGDAYTDGSGHLVQEFAGGVLRA